MASKTELIDAAFLAMNRGDPTQFAALLDPQARWLGVPNSDGNGGLAECHNPAEILGLLARRHAGGRRSTPAEFFTRGPRVAVRLTLTDPRWSDAVETFKVLTFDEATSRLILIEDCTDRENAAAILGGSTSD